MTRLKYFPIARLRDLLEFARRVHRSNGRGLGEDATRVDVQPTERLFILLRVLPHSGGRLVERSARMPRGYLARLLEGHPWQN